MEALWLASSENGAESDAEEFERQDKIGLAQFFLLEIKLNESALVFKPAPCYDTP